MGGENSGKCKDCVGAAYDQLSTVLCAASAVRRTPSSSAPAMRRTIAAPRVDCQKAHGAHGCGGL